MNKNAIQKYAIWARNELIEQVSQRAYQYGVTAAGYGDENASVVGGRVLTSEEKSQRKAFVDEIKKKGFKQAAEEVAYTWFNRFVALRYMEVNDFLPTHVRVFSDSTGAFSPEILTNVLHLDLPGLDKAKVSELLNANKTEELYRYLLLTQCNALNALLPEMFEKMGAYTEMLLPNNILKADGVLGRLVSDIIPEDTWRDSVQIIGWLYQYYNTEPKQAVFDGLKKNVKITRENIPAATQLFTPDWIVRYMVENSIGRLWLESHPNSALKTNWKYYLDEAEQTPEVAEHLRVLRAENAVKSPEDIRLMDCCMGSGHVLVYAFDVLMQIYTSEGYAERDAAKLILEKNIYGLEIDRRAYQLAYFALMMKARQYNRRILTLDVRPQVYEPTGYPDGMEYGSLVRVDKLEAMPTASEELTLFDNYAEQMNTWNFRRLLAQKYDVVVTNPPYMGSKGMTAKMSEYVQKHFPDSKSDLFAVFIERCGQLIKPSGYQAMITQHAWMFLSSYEKLRGKLLQRDIVNMAHLGARAFEEIGGEVVQTTAFVLNARKTSGFVGTYARLVDFGSQDEKEMAFLSGANRHTATADNFAKIPGSPVAYWVGAKVQNCFSIGKPLRAFGKVTLGMRTGDNDRFLRFWYEVDTEKFCSFASSSEFARRSGCKWFPYNKGGEFRKWYGNTEYVVNWENDGFEIKENTRLAYPQLGENLGWKITSEDKYFSSGITWSRISNIFGARLCESNLIFDTAAPMFFPNSPAILQYIAGLMCSNASSKFLSILNPTLTFQVVDVGNLPVIISNGKEGKIATAVESSFGKAKDDWDAFEVSWDFARHPLINGERTVAAAFAKWERTAAERFDTLKANEEELNRIFIDIYGLQDELTPEVEDKDVTVRRADLGREIRSLISYAVGCMFGRYSLDADGLAYAGGEWDTGKYRRFIPDKDNIMPICDDEYFDDDITGRFVDFVRIAYGADTLEENLRFVANALGGSGTPREIIRKYFLNDFYRDHCKIYQKRPIYWLFDSGKKNGFKALIYMHRYSRDLLAKMRTDYVHEQQERYRTQLSHIASALTSAQGAERARLLKQQDKLTEQAKEIGAYEEKVYHLADMNIAIDLDDGVKKNYAIFEDVLAKI